MEPFFIYRDEDSPPSAGEARVAVQPSIAVAQRPCEAGSQALEGYRPPEDAELIRRLREAKIALGGSVRMSEFGLGLAGGAAGQAVSTGAAEAEIMLDLSGESRAAAALAGLWGFKAGYGTVSRRGLTGLAPSMEGLGIIARSPVLIRKILASVSGPDGEDYSQPDDGEPDFSPRGIEPGKVRIAVITEAGEALTVEEKEAYGALQEDLSRRGFVLDRRSLKDFHLFPLVHRIVASVEASSSTGRYDSVRYGTRSAGGEGWQDMYLQSRGEAFGTLVKSFLLQGAYFQFQAYEAYKDACRIRSRLLQQVLALESQGDFFLFPLPFDDVLFQGGDLEEHYRRFAPSLFANVSGLPVLTLPPIEKGMTCQIAAPRLGGPGLLELGEYLYDQEQGD